MLRRSKVEGGARHGVNHRLRKGVDGGGIIVGGRDHHDAAGLFIRNEVDEVQGPREAATQSRGQVVGGVGEVR